MKQVALALLCVVFLAMVAAFVFVPAPASADTPAVAPAAQAPSGRLALVKSRGKLICGVNDALPGFSALDKATGQFAGFDADYCRAVATAVLGDPKAVEFRPLNTGQRGPALQTGEIDVLIPCNV
jgi:general L-amino acid transport system substrate-binding protein